MVATENRILKCFPCGHMRSPGSRGHRGQGLPGSQGLPERYKDHPLKGDWKGYRDAHVGPHWLLIYRVVGDELHLVRTGTHADLFSE